ncbi:MAG: DUF302 domain-containing protein [Gammaproteobacteria bacterium]|nr:DUF302 domain-containing protein [Gammaproteobacteria bacterium]
MKFIYKGVWVLCALLFTSQLFAAQMIMVRSTQSFPEAMLALQSAIKQQGYTVSRVQRVDIGLTNSGYQTDKYRVVFFGKAEEVHELTRKHPELLPYLPWKIVIFAEQDETLLASLDPESFNRFFPDDDLGASFERWRKDIYDILERVRSAEN